MAGILKVDTIQNANADNIITQTNSTTLTIGASGDTVTLAAGATSSGFGATYNGAVNWDTTPKTTTVTAVSGTGYFINTTSGGVTVNLPAGSAGSVVALADYAATWNTNNVTVNANGTEKIGGVASAPATLNTQGQAVTFIYVDSTQGWTNVGDATKVTGNAFVTATGGTITTCGDFKIHSFTGPGTFTVTNAGNPVGSTTVDYLVIAGGGGGSADGGQPQGGAGGGAGGFRQSFPNPATAGFPVTAQAYPITVGGGGAGSAGTGCKGSDSIFSTITSTGGGQGGVYNNVPGSPGGSGGGGGAGSSSTGGTGNTPPVSPSQGNPGSGGVGPGTPGAGGGATSAGSGQNGGSGTTSTINGSPVTRGGGGASGTPGGSAGPGGGGAKGTAGTANTGGGGGGNNSPAAGGTGGSGIVVIRYKFQ
jgi:hypothetical protein